MEKDMQSSPLLDLPPELRSHIWESVFSAPTDRTVDQYVGSRRASSRNDVLAITLVNRQLRSESLPFFWSCTQFRIQHYGHRADSAFDSYFYTWLRKTTDDEVKFIRRLELKVKVPFVLPKPGDMDPSVAIIDIDLNCPNVDDAVSVLGYYSTCPLVILPRVRKAVTNVPRVDRKPIVSKEVLWDIYEACYLLTRSDPRDRRTWAEFQRAFELNRSKVRPRAWSEEVYYEMSQEAIHGAGWQAEKKRPARILWDVEKD